MMKYVLLALAASSLATSVALAQPVQWPASAGGTGDYYERVDTTGTLTFQQAYDAAAARSYNGIPGHLLVLDNANYTPELNWVYNNVYYRAANSGLDCNWIAAFRPADAGGSKYDGWSWLYPGSASVPVPTSITDNWFIDQFEGPGDEGAVLSKATMQPGDYIATDSSNLVTGYLVEYGNGALPLPGDANTNGSIDPDDYALTDRGRTKGLTGWSNGDFNNDGTVNSADYLLLDQSFGAQNNGHFSPDLLSARQSEFGDDYVAQLLASVPEPGTLATCALGLLGFGHRPRRSTHFRVSR